jgi:hypothetical protein
MSPLLRPAAILALASVLALDPGCCVCPMGGGGGGASSPPQPSPYAPDPVPPPQPALPETGVHLLRVEVWLPSTKPDGRAWDAGGGPPDPFVVVRQGGRTLATTDRMQDSLSAAWTLDIPIDPAEIVTLDVYDRDLAEHDTVGSVPFSPTETVVEGELDAWGGGRFRVEVRHLR